MSFPLTEILYFSVSYLDGAIINCMGMAMESILARPNSAISRNSDDFVPDKEGGFSEHLLQNAYNALYHNELYCCDWDMFWTMHEDCVKHSLLRAVSGGPVYISDKIGATNLEVLKPLVYKDGRILMMNRSAKPTEDGVFSDPLQDGVLKLHNIAQWGEHRVGGGIAVYNLSNQEQSFTLQAADIPDLEIADTYWLFDYFKNKVYYLKRNESYQGTVEKDGFGWFSLLPQGRNSSCLGLLNKYIGFTAVESICENDNTEVIVVREIKEKTYLGEDGLFVTEEEYPKFVRQEIIVNAITHRDYSIRGTDIQIKIFDDRIVVESPGKLPGLVKVDNIRHTHFSRNPKIAEFLKVYNFVKEYGEGVDRMYKELEAAGLQGPEYRQNAFMLQATVRNKAFLNKKSL